MRGQLLKSFNLVRLGFDLAQCLDVTLAAEINELLIRIGGYNVKLSLHAVGASSGFGLHNAGIRSSAATPSYTPVGRDNTARTFNQGRYVDL